MQVPGGARSVRDVGEFSLIAGLRNIIDTSRVRSSGMQLGIGDDSALWRPRPGREVAVTTDMLVEAIHFRHDWSDAGQIGHRALAVNLSDLAAMGARPRVAVVSLGLRGSETDRWVYDFYLGMLKLAQRWHVRVVGGDIVSSPHAMTISVTALGEVRPGQSLRRDAAESQDLVAVTGPLGLSAAGARLLSAGSIRVDGAPAMLDAHRVPQPRILHGMLLVRAGVRCAMDLSDGLLGDLPKICNASGLSALLDQDDLPVPHAVRWNFPDWLELALRGGEDFELLFTASEETFARVQQLFRRCGLSAPVAIGKLNRPRTGDPRITLRYTDMHREDLAPGAWDHFRSAALTH